jgi:hypothetical protein
MAKFPSAITQPYVLVVEGDEEKFFFQAFINHLGLGQIQIVPIGGKTELRRNLSTLVITSGHENMVSLGVVRDADLNPASAFQSVCGALQAVGLTAPIRPLLTSGQNPRVTIMILPAEGITGMLEDVCLKSVTGDAAMPCVEQYFQCLQDHTVPLPKNMSKAKVQVFLASREEAGKRLGEAAHVGYWPFGDNAFGPVKDFLQQISLQTDAQL